MRDSRLFLSDIDVCCGRILRYVSGLTAEQFAGSDLEVDGVLRNLTVIGEAVKQLPESVRAMDDEVPWSLIARFRDLVMHVYFRVEISEVWDIAEHEIPELQMRVQRMLDQLSQE